MLDTCCFFLEKVSTSAKDCSSEHGGRPSPGTDRVREYICLVVPLVFLFVLLYPIIIVPSRASQRDEGLKRYNIRWRLQPQNREPFSLSAMLPSSAFKHNLYSRPHRSSLQTSRFSTMEVRTLTSTRVHGSGKPTNQASDHEYEVKVRFHPSPFVIF